MTSQEIRTLEMFKRLRGFDATHGANFAQGGAARELFDAVRQVIDELEAHAAAQSAAEGLKRQKSAGKAAAREALRDKLEAIRRTARALASTIPGVEDRFRFKRAVGDQSLINAARAIAQEAQALKAEFVKLEMPAAFVEDLQAAIDDLVNADREQNDSKGAHKRAVTSIDGAVERGMDAARRLDPVIRNKFADRPSVLADWERSRHIERASRPQRDAAGNDNSGAVNNNQPVTP